MPKVTWFWPTPSRFDVANITTQGYHNAVTFPMIVRGTPPATLSGVLTLSTCSNVCLLTDYPFSVIPTTQDADFAHDYARAMGNVPLLSGLTDSLEVGIGRENWWLRPRERRAGHRQSSLLIRWRTSILVNLACT
ncbi:copper-sensitivity suppressor membrane protein B [Salmonella bongori]|nr:copper-sensitivity suppressor membrane protein B [Salmonella bongori]